MPAVTYPNLGLVAGFATYESGWGDYISEDIKKLSILVQSGVIDKYTNEPGSPTEGDIILLNQSNVNNPNTIAIYMSGTWEYYVPMKGWLVYNRGQNYFELFDGTIWTSIFGTTATTFAAGNDSRIVNALQSSAIGTTVQAQIAAGTTSQYWRGDKSWQTLDKTAVGLSNVDNTSDASKPISTATQTALDLKAPLASPTFTGTVSGITKSMVGLGNVDNTSDASKPISTATQTALDGKLDGVEITNDTTTNATRYPTFVNGTSSGVTSEQISSTKLSFNPSTGILTATGFSGTGTGLTGLEPSIAAGTTAQYWRGDKSWQTLNSASVGLGNVNNTSDASKPISTATQTALDLKAPLASPTFTGTVAGITKSMVGLANVDNTSDASKPVSTAQQTALDGKEATITAGTTAQYWRGDKSWQTLNAAAVGLSNVNNTSDASKPISTATQTALDLKAPLASPTFTGTVSGITKAMVGLGNVDNTSDANKPVSTATQTALNLKAPIASPSFTGLVSIAATGDGTEILSLDTERPWSFYQRGAGASAMLSFENTTGKTFSMTNGTAGLANITFNPSDAGATISVNGNLVYHAGNKPTKTDVGLANVDNTSDANKPVSTAQQTALNLKANLASPTFTGTVSGITASMVGLGNVENKSSATIRGEITGSNVTTALGWTPVQQGTGTGQGTNVIKIGWSGTRLKATVDVTDQGNFVFDSHLAGYAPLASPTFTGTVSGITKSMVGLGSVDNTADSAKPVSTAQQTALNLKANLAGGALFTGRVVADAGVSGNNGLATATSNLGELEVQGNGTGGAFMCFHRPGSHAAYFGLDTDNTWRVGGWSMGAASYKIYHEGNKPTLSQLSNDSGFITSSGRAYPRNAGGGDMNWNWSGQAGQPTWLWGGSDGTNFYVWNPSNFSVNYANSAGSASSATTATALSSSPGSAPHYSCRAWVSFNGAATIAIVGAGNVSSLGDVGNGTYQVNLTTAMPDTLGVIQASAGYYNGTQQAETCDWNSASQLLIRTIVGNTGALIDNDNIYVAVFR